MRGYLSAMGGRWHINKLKKDGHQPALRYSGLTGHSISGAVEVSTAFSA
ncbi:hypothetical protein ACLB1R_33535 [Escherichia coli]